MKGTYCLLIEVPKDLDIKIGRLGKLRFDKGRYVYVGSAMNSLEKRIERHFTKDKKKFWHIDYLLSNKNIKIKKVYLNLSKEKLECAIAKKINKNNVQIKNFGCSDCKCTSHLFMILSENLHDIF